MSDTMQTISDDIIRNEEGRQWGETAFDNVKGYIGFLGEQIDGIREMLRMERREHEATKAMLLEAKPYTVGYDTDLPKRIDAVLLARPEGDAKDGESDRLADAVGLRIVGLEKTFSEANRPEWAKLCRAALFDLDKLKNYAHTMERGVCVLTSRSPREKL